MTTSGMAPSTWTLPATSPLAGRRTRPASGTPAQTSSLASSTARAHPNGEGHLIVDNVSTDETPAVQARLAQHTPVVFHFTRTSAAWANQIETSSSSITSAAILRSTQVHNQRDDRGVGARAGRRARRASLP